MKKFLKGICIFIFAFLIGIPSVFASDLCSNNDILRGIRVLGYCISIAKILVPVLIVITGMKSLFVAMVEDKDDIKETVSLLIKKILTGIFIAFIPLIIHTILGFVSDYSKFIEDYEACETCLNDVSNCAAK